MIRNQNTIVLNQSAIGHNKQFREYQLVTGGEDGMVFWWNLRAPYITDLSAITPCDFRKPNAMLTRVIASEIEPL